MFKILSKFKNFNLYEDPSENIKEDLRIPNVLFTSFKTEKCELIEQQLQKWEDLNTDFEIKYFSDKDIDDFFNSFENKEAKESYFTLKNGVAKADFFRVCYIYKYGGYWFDLDLEPVKIDRGYILDFFDMGYKNVSYMLIGGIKKTEIFRMLVEKISYNIINKKNKQGKDIMDVTGPRVLQKILGEIYTDIQFNDGKFGGKIKRKFQNREYTFFTHA